MDTLIIVLGPTGVGKSDISIQLAKHYHTEIVSADSRQFFRELTIGTAVPSSDDLNEINHHFIQNKSIHHYYNVSEYETEALQLIQELHKKFNPLILTGGSMLYLDTICNGIDDIPTVDPEIRNEVIRWYEENGIEALRQRLQEVDQRVRGPVAFDLGLWFMQSGQGAFLHGQIGLDVVMRGGGALVA